MGSSVLGLGSSVPGYGVSARAWSHNRLGVQFEVSRGTLLSATAPGRLTSLQFAPGVMYSFRDLVTSFVWVRPYVGGGFSLRHETLTSANPAASDLVADSHGFQALGGTELTFSSVPRFALGVDFLYVQPRTPFAGFDLGGPGVALSGHWYVR